MRTAALAVLTLLLFSAAAGAGEMAITVRAADVAALVSGDEAAVMGLRGELMDMERRQWRLGELGKLLDEKYGEVLEVELFRRLRLEDSGVFESLRMPLRRAVLLAALPPVESLSFDEAREVLEAFGIRVARREEYDALSEEEKIREAFTAATQLVVLSGTGPGSEVKMVMIRKE
ncbi:MAG: hypothetical protein ABIH66_08750 [bacterium]